MASAAISLLLVALLWSSLIAPHHPAAYARHVAVVLQADDGLKNTGGLRVPATANAAGSPRATKTVDMPAASGERHRQDAAAEIRDMLWRDYGGQHNGWVEPKRRRPIHNSEPLKDEP